MKLSISILYAFMPIFGFIMLLSGLLMLILFWPFGVLMIIIGIALIGSGFDTYKNAREYERLGGKEGTGMSIQDFLVAKIKLEKDLKEEKKKQNIQKVKDLTKR